MVSNWTIWPNELNQKGFPFFPRNTQYRAKLKGPLSVFCIVEVFFRKFFNVLKGSSLQFILIFHNRMDVKISERVPPPFSEPTYAVPGLLIKRCVTLWKDAIFQYHSIVFSMEETQSLEFTFIGSCTGFFIGSYLPVATGNLSLPEVRQR